MSTGFTHEPGAGGSAEWYTPAWFFEALGDHVLFDLDPASPPEGPLPWIPAQKFYSPVEDGLAQTWKGTVWLNPPYSGIEAWARRMADHGDGLFLSFSRTETRWFQETMLPKADMVFFLKKRIPFVDRSGQPPVSPKTGKKSGPGCGSLLIAFGGLAVATIEGSTLQGVGWYL